MSWHENPKCLQSALSQHASILVPVADKIQSYHLDISSCPPKIGCENLIFILGSKIFNFAVDLTPRLDNAFPRLQASAGVTLAGEDPLGCRWPRAAFLESNLQQLIPEKEL